MSEPTAPAAGTSPEPSPRFAAAVKAAPMKGRWRRRIIRGLVVIILLAAVFRVALFFLLRPTLARVSQAYGVNITFDRQELTLVGGDVGLWGLKITPKDGTEPLLVCDYVRGYVSPTDLLRARLQVLRAEADGVDLALERTSDGKIPLLDIIATATANSPPPAPKPADRTKPLDFTSPLTIEAFRLNHVRAKVRDAFVSPPLEALVSMDVRLSNLGNKDRPAHFEIDLWSDPILDSLRISGDARSEGRNLDALATVFMRGLHPAPLAPYLQALGIKPVGKSVAADLNVSLKTLPAAEPSRGVKATLAIDDINLTCDSQPAAALKALRVDADDLSPTSAAIASVLVEGGRVFTTRSEKGLVRVAGLELAGAATAPAAVAPPAQVSKPPASATTAPSRFALAVRKITLRDLAATLSDRSVSPPSELQVSLRELGTGGEGIDSTRADTIVPISGALAVPGIIRDVRIDGTVKPLAADKSVKLAFAAQGIKPDALRPYLAAAGIDSTLRDGRLDGELSATLHTSDANDVTADARLSKLRFSDGPDLFVLEDVNIVGAGIDPTSGRIKLATVEVKGPAVDVKRDAEGRLAAAGFRWTPSTATPLSAAAAGVTPAAPASQPAAPLAIALPRVELGHVAWSGAKLRLRDERVQPPSSLVIDDAGIDLRDLVLDLQAGAPQKPGSIRVWLNTPQLAKQLTVEGTIRPSPHALAMDLNVNGRGIDGSTIATYLKPMGIEPTVRDGTVAAHAALNVAQPKPGELAASVAISGARLNDGERELGGIDSLKVDDLAIGAGRLDVKAIHISHPRIEVTRQSDGALEALGVKVLPTTAPATAAAPLAAAAVAPNIAPAAGPIVSAPPVTASLGELRVEGAQVRWIDRAAPRLVQVTALADAQLAGLVLGKPGAPPATLHSELSADGTLGQMLIDAKIDPNFDAPALRATVAARGIRAGALAPYLPPGVELSTTDGRLNATLEAGLSKNPQGGHAAQLVVSNVKWQDGENAPLLAMDSFRVIAPRIDLPGNVVVIDEVSLAGLRAQAEIEPDGSTRTLGLTLRTPPPHPAESAQATPVAAAVAAAAAAAASSPRISAVPKEGEVARLIADARRPLPSMSLKKLDLNVEQVAIKDLRHSDAAPLALEDLRVSNPQPIELGGADAESKPPVQLQLTGKIDPVVNAFTVSTVTTPLASEPAGTIDIAASGIRGSGITELRPDLTSMLDGSGLTDGRFKTQLQLHAKLDRHGPRDLDLSKPFQLGVALNGLEFRDGAASADAPALAGLELVQADEVKVDPRNATVIVKSLEISKPSARAYRDASGIHAMGMLIPVKKAATQPATQPGAAPSEPTLASATSAAGSSSPSPASAASAAKPAGEVRIDRLTISGLDVRVEDRSVDPTLLVPLNNLDVDVRGLTTLALSEPRTIRFDAIVNADKVPLPANRKETEGGGGGGIIGALGGVAKAASGQKTESAESTIEQRELFSQIAASGELALYPEMRGRVKTAVNGVELAAFKGLAKDFGVTLEQGVFDTTADVAFEQDGSMHVRSKPMLTDLKMSEQSGGGALSTYLKAPLDVVIIALRDTSGTITVPLNFPVEKGKLSGAGIAAAASGAFLPMVATAVASAAPKAAIGVTQMVGLGNLLGGGKGKHGPEPLVISFAPGSTTISPDDQAKLAALLEQARRDKNMQLTIHHDLGGGDVAIAEQRANPTLDDASAMAQQLRAKKLELADRRAQLASRVRAQVAWLPAEQSQAVIEDLRALDRQIAQTEQSLDQLYDLMRPGADRQATRRARAAAVQIAQDRLTQVTRLLQPEDLPKAADRVHAASAQFNPADGDEAGGRITVTPLTKGH